MAIAIYLSGGGGVWSLSCVQLFMTPWTVARQAPLSMGLPRQEYWSGLPFPSPGNLPDQGLNPYLLQVSCIAGGFFTPEPSGKPYWCPYSHSFPPNSSMSMRPQTSVFIMHLCSSSLNPVTSSDICVSCSIFLSYWVQMMDTVLDFIPL